MDFLFLNPVVVVRMDFWSEKRSGENGTVEHLAELLRCPGKTISSYLFAHTITLSTMSGNFGGAFPKRKMHEIGMFD